MKFKNIKIKNLLLSLFITAAYPFVKSYISEYNKLLIFIDTLTIVSFIMIIIGVVYSLYLKGDFDITSYILNRSATKSTKSLSAFMSDSKVKREDSFNYPLFVGLFYLTVSVVIAYRFY